MIEGMAVRRDGARMRWTCDVCGSTGVSHAPGNAWLALERHRLAEHTVWDCEAYGPTPELDEDLCFFDLAGRCTSAAQCSTRMAVERRRLFAAIQQQAADGEPFAVDLARAFTSPEQLLRGNG